MEIGRPCAVRLLLDDGVAATKGRSPFRIEWPAVKIAFCKATPVMVERLFFECEGDDDGDWDFGGVLCVILGLSPFASDMEDARVRLLAAFRPDFTLGDCERAFQREGDNDDDDDGGALFLSLPLSCREARRRGRSFRSGEDAEEDPATSPPSEINGTGKVDASLPSLPMPSTSEASADFADFADLAEVLTLASPSPPPSPPPDLLRRLRPGARTAAGMCARSWSQPPSSSSARSPSSSNMTRVRVLSPRLSRPPSGPLIRTIRQNYELYLE